MSHVTQVQGAEGAGRRDRWGDGANGLRVAAGSGRFVIGPAPFAMRYWALGMVACSGIILLGEVAYHGEVRAQTVLGVVLGAAAIMGIQYLYDRRAVSLGPFLVADRERGTMELPRSGDAFRIDDVDSVILRRDSAPYAEGTADASRLGLTVRRDGSAERISVVWSISIRDVEGAAARLAESIGRPLLPWPDDPA